MIIDNVQTTKDIRLSSFEKASEAALYFSLPENFVLDSGVSLRNGKLAFESWGQLNPARDNAILVFSGMSSGSHLATSEQDSSTGWWNSAIGIGKPIDTQKYFVICASMLGSCWGSSGPASIDPRNNRRMGHDFPILTARDQAKAMLPLLAFLELNELVSVIGLSMGGSLAKSFTTCFEGSIRSLVLVSSALEPSAHATLWRRMQMEYVETDPNWQCGQYSRERWPRDGMLSARRLGLSTYTGTENLDGLGSGLENFVESKSKSFVDSFDPLTFLRLIEQQNGISFNEEITSKINNVHVIGSSSDILYPPYQQVSVAKKFLPLCKNVELNILPSGNGHDMFLREQERVAKLIARGMNEAKPCVKTSKAESAAKLSACTGNSVEKNARTDEGKSYTELGTHTNPLTSSAPRHADVSVK